MHGEKCFTRTTRAMSIAHKAKFGYVQIHGQPRTVQCIRAYDRVLRSHKLCMFTVNFPKIHRIKYHPLLSFKSPIVYTIWFCTQIKRSGWFIVIFLIFPYLRLHNKILSSKLYFCWRWRTDGRAQLSLSSSSITQRSQLQEPAPLISSEWSLPVSSRITWCSPVSDLV